MESSLEAFRVSDKFNHFVIPNNSQVIVFAHGSVLKPKTNLDDPLVHLEIGHNSTLEVYQICCPRYRTISNESFLSESVETKFVESIRIKQLQGSHLKWFKVISQTCSSVVRVDLDSSHTQTELLNLVLPNSNTNVDLDHQIVANSRQNRIIQTTKGIQNQLSDCKIKHLIQATKKVKNFEATQKIQMLKNFCNAKTELQPILEIFSPSVVCSHGASIGSFDPNEILFLRSRGLNELIVNNLLGKAFIEEMLSQVPILCIKMEIENLTQKYFNLY